jgi:hypothetical protein
MSQELLALVRQDLLLALRPLGFQVVQAESADSFDNATVVLRSNALQLRIVRERSILFVDLGPPTEPNTWFDSAVIIDYLALSARAGFHGRNPNEVLQGVGTFVNTFWGELRALFAQPDFARRKLELIALKEARATRLFGK